MSFFTLVQYAWPTGSDDKENDSRASESRLIKVLKKKYNKRTTYCVSNA